MPTLVLWGCPHESDPDRPKLVGHYRAMDPRRTILGSQTLTITDAHHLTTNGGKVVEYTVDEEFFRIDRGGDNDLFYSDGYYGYPPGLLFQHFDKASDASQNIFYRRIDDQ